MTQATPDAPLVRPTVQIVSPLRYPGSKRRLVGYLARALELSRFPPDLLVEPFAGGASVALQLLASGAVERAALGEKDPLVADFWRTVFAESEWLCREVRRWTPSVAEWERLRALTPRTARTRARKCLFLNRTSFSGVLAETAGPIGGKAQASAYDIGCRFPKDRLQRRIRQAAALAPRVPLVHGGDWAETVEAALALTRPEEAFVYLDPPFYHKADRLYRHHFDDAEHERLADGVAALAGRGVPFVLSYDAADEVAALYEARGLAPARVELVYSATGRGGPSRAAELIVSNLPVLPEATRVWRTQAEWMGRPSTGSGQAPSAGSGHGGDGLASPTPELSVPAVPGCGEGDDSRYP